MKNWLFDQYLALVSKTKQDSIMDTMEED